mmetsp:Transcript_19693/g.52591  ORF Transcript_19693/g.52591 Transcript_19693/m.52591 type:complete len:219 (-) Transcript_19693:1300-1956(-)
MRCSLQVRAESDSAHYTLAASDSPKRCVSTALSKDLGEFVLPNLRKSVKLLTKFAREDFGRKSVVSVPRLSSNKIGRHLMLIVSRMRDARLVLARDVGQIVDPRRHPQLETSLYHALAHNVENAARHHRSEFLHWKSVPIDGVVIGDRDVASRERRVLLATAQPHVPHVVETDDGAYHAHQRPNLLMTLALRDAIDDNTTVHVCEMHLAAVLQPCPLL